MSYQQLKGTIKLINKHGKVVEKTLYQDARRRKEAISCWMRKYKNRFVGYYLHICPNVATDWVRRSDGGNYGSSKLIPDVEEKIDLPVEVNS